MSKVIKVCLGSYDPDNCTKENLCVNCKSEMEILKWLANNTPKWEPKK